MKKLALLLLSVLCISLVSCRKESHYSIRYTDYSTAMANVTLFEYDYSFDLVKTREIKNIEPGFPLSSHYYGLVKLISCRNENLRFSPEQRQSHF